MSASPPLRFRLGASKRIKRRRDFLGIKNTGKRIVLGCLIANWQPLAPGAVSRLGVVTSRRIGSAVARNRARRVMRESFRLHRHELAAPMDLVLVARPSIAGKPFAHVERDLLTIIGKAAALRPDPAPKAKQ